VLRSDSLWKNCETITGMPGKIKIIILQCRQHFRARKPTLLMSSNRQMIGVICFLPIQKYRVAIIFTITRKTRPFELDLIHPGDESGRLRYDDELGIGVRRITASGMLGPCIGVTGLKAIRKPNMEPFTLDAVE